MEKKLRSSAEEFLSAATSDPKSNQSKSSLKTLIDAIPRSSSLSSSLPSSLLLSLSKTLDSFKSTARDHSRSPPPKKSRLIDEESTIKEIKIYVFIIKSCISSPKKSFNLADFLPCVRVLHDCLVLFEGDEELCVEIVNLCENWWREGVLERESLISQALPFLLSRSLTLNRKVYVHRVYAMREAFLLFDFQDESIEDLKLLLLRCVITPLFLKTEEGRRFIAFILSVNGKLLKEALTLIKSQIPFGRKTVLEAYSDILFRFWKNSEGSYRNEFEDGFLQSLIEGAIYASSKSLANSIRRVIRGFVDNRSIDGVDKLLFRLVEPILFRSLQVANSNVRQNALHLLIDLFPLEDPDATREDKAALLEKQSFLLERLLEDDSPEIRSVAVEGCCRVLHHFWEVIPSSTITKMLTNIIDHISRDSINDVKLSTLKGVTYLLGNPQTLEVLKVLIPRLGFMFLDPSLSVRVHICDLLLASRAIRNFQFTKVVDLDILLSSLAKDHPQVAQKIVTLLTPSYFPSKLATKESCARFIALIKRSPAAGARFCEFISQSGSSTPKSLIELVKVCYTLTKSSQDLTETQIDGLFAATANLCKELSTETSQRQALSKFFTKEKLKSLLPTISSVRSQSSIIGIVSSVHPDDLGEFREYCLKLMKRNAENHDEVSRINRMMINRGCSDDVFQTLAETLEIVVSDVKVGRKNVGRTMRKCRKKKFDHGLAAMAASQIKDLVAGEETRRAVLDSPFLGSIASSLGVISRSVIENSDGLNEADDLLILAAYTKLALIISLEDGPVGEERDLEEILEGLLESSEKRFTGPDPEDQKTARDSPPATRSRTKDTRPVSSPSSLEGAGEEGKADGPSDGTRLAALLLKFITDAATLSLIPATNPRFPAFASSAVRHVTSIARQPGRRVPAAKSIFSYAAKLLHVILPHDMSPRVLSSLADDLLDLAAAARLATAVGPWLPDILLSLACPYLAKCHVADDDCGMADDDDRHVTGDGACRVPDNDVCHVAFWVKALDADMAAAEVARAAAALLKKGDEVARAVAAAVTEKVRVAAEVGEFGAVLGMIRWMCVDIGGTSMEGFTEAARACVERALESVPAEQRDERQLLESALEVLDGSHQS